MMTGSDPQSLYPRQNSPLQSATKTESGGENREDLSSDFYLLVERRDCDYGLVLVMIQTRYTPEVSIPARIAVSGRATWQSTKGK